MISFAGALILIFVFVFIIIYSVYRIRTTRSSGFEKNTGDFSRSAQSAQFDMGDYIFTNRRRAMQFVLGFGLLFFDVLIFIPLIANYFTFTMNDPFIGFIVIFIPFGVVLALLVSSFLKLEVLEWKNVRYTMIALLVVFFLDLWFPRMAVLGDGRIAIFAGYRVSADYVVYSFWRRLIGTSRLGMSIGSLTLGWMLTYFATTMVVLGLVYVFLRTNRWDLE